MSAKGNRIPLFLVVTALFWFALYSYVPTLSPYAVSIGASLSMVGVISGSYGLLQLICRLPIGILSDKYNQRKLYVILGMVFCAVSTLGMALLPNPWLLLIFRGLSGVAASMWVGYTVLYSGYFPPEKSVAAIGVINAVNLAGQTLANYLGGLSSQLYGDAAPFYLGFVAAILGLVLSFFVVEKRDSAKKREPIKLRELAKVARTPALVCVSVLAIIAQLISFGAAISFAPVLAKELGATGGELGVLSMVATLPGIVTNLLAGSLLARRFGEKACIVVCFAAIAVCCALFPFAGSLMALYILQFLCGAFRSALATLQMGLSIKTVEPAKRATAMGFYQAVYSIGMFLGPVLVGAVGDGAGLTVGYLMMSGFGLVGMVLSALFLGDYARKPKAAPATEA